jgi:hypothetical protein
MKQPEALRLADALDELDRQFSRNGLCGDAAAELRRLHEVNQDLLEALHEALKTEQEPVAWISDSPTKGNGKQLHWAKSEAWRWSSNITPLYTAPPKREWVGLTDEEIQDLSYLSQKIDASNSEWFDRWEFARAIEQALKEKNKW